MVLAAVDSTSFWVEVGAGSRFDAVLAVVRVAAGVGVSVVATRDVVCVVGGDVFMVVVSSTAPFSRHR